MKIFCKGELIYKWIFYCNCNRDSLRADNNTLYITNAMVENQGNYYCYGSDENNDFFFGRATVLVMGNIVYEET